MKRNKAVDFVAGIMITYMVFTHVCQHLDYDKSPLYVNMEHVFYFFMPWFFFKAGMFFHMGESKEVFKKSFDRLIRPFILYSFIGHLCYLVVCYIKGSFHLSTLIPWHSLLMQGSIPGNLPLWFLLSLFCCRIILNELIKRGISVSWIIVLSLLGAYYLHLINFEGPFYFANTLTGLFFMSLGYKCGPPRLLYVCILIYAISLAYPSFVGMRSNHLYYGFYLLWIIYSVCGILMANYIGSVVIKHSCAKRVPIIKILNLIGEYSMEIYCIHWIVLLFI